MLPLDPPRWSELEHAYGAADDIPALISQLSDFPKEGDYRSEPFFSLWSALCHQDDVYSASYAAVPHIVRIAQSDPSRATLSYFSLPVMIELNRIAGRGPEINDHLKAPYFASLKLLGEVAGSELAKSPDALRSQYLRAAVALGNGNVTDAAQILDPDSNA